MTTIISGGLFLFLWAIQVYDLVPVLWICLITNIVFGGRVLLGVRELGYSTLSLDERQLFVRYKATQLAQNIIVITLTLITVFHFLTTTENFSFLSGLSLDRPTVFFTLGGLTIFIALLPNMMIAWLEPDPIEETSGGIPIK